jgi:sarcosine oxidase
MTAERYDVAVLGLGGMGSAALYHLAKRGVSICGIERHGVAHELGSSHGATRLIRKAYFEHPDYIPLLDRAYELWRELGQECGHSIFNECGLLISGPEDSPVIAGLGQCYAEHELPHERMAAAEAQRRYPDFRFPPDHMVYVDPIAGYLHVERGVEQHIALAQSAGARVLIHEDALSWRVSDGSVTVKTAHREIQAGTLVICAGPWAQDVLAEIRVPLTVRRKVQSWFKPKTNDDRARSIPAFFFHLDWGMFYGTPALDDLGIKLAEHSGGEAISDPDNVQRRVTDDDMAPLHRVTEAVMPDFDLQQSQVSVCMYTMTPDEHFIIDRHPEHPNVLIAAGFSGHGYKFAPVIGETLAQLALDGGTTHPVDFLRLDRAALRP